MSRDGSNLLRVATLLVVSTAALLTGVGAARYSGLTTAQSNPTPTATDEPVATFTPDFVDVMDSETDAITRSLNRFPDGANPHGAIARLVPLATLRTWSGIVEFDFADHVPVWITAVLGDNMQFKHVVRLPGVQSEDSRAIAGAWYAWDANSGDLIAEGALITLTPYADLQQLTSQSMSIMPATLPPPEPTIHPTYYWQFTQP
jgi:hypothetical protein